MASKTLITSAQYLSTHFEREPEFVHGELVEKSLPNLNHGVLQIRLGVLLSPAGTCCSEVRMRLAEDLFRLPDLALFEQAPGSDPPTSPPLVIVEIASPDDRLRDVEQKLQEYRDWGVTHVWFIEAELKKLYIYDRGLINVAQLELPRFGITITPADLFV